MDDITLGKLLISPEKRAVFHDGEERRLTAREFDILLLLAQSPGRVFTRSQISTGVFGYDSEERDSSISVLINRLRAKIEPDPSRPRFIETIQGVGYSFAAESKSS